MSWRWVVFFGVVAAGCGHPSASATGSDFLGDWECTSGTRDIDCGQGVVTADLALGPPDVLRFIEGTSTDLFLLVPSRAVVPGLSAEPTCELAFDAAAYEAVLHAESFCSDDQGEVIVIHEGVARTVPGQLTLTTDATTSMSCAVKTSAMCRSIAN